MWVGEPLWIYESYPQYIEWLHMPRVGLRCIFSNQGRKYPRYFAKWWESRLETKQTEWFQIVWSDWKNLFLSISVRFEGNQTRSNFLMDRRHRLYQINLYCNTKPS